jgi:hypothetical protein
VGRIGSGRDFYIPGGRAGWGQAPDGSGGVGSAKIDPRPTLCRLPLNSIDLTGLTFPVTVNRVARFEKINPMVSINVYALGKDGQEIITKFLTKCGASEKHVDLFLFSSPADDSFH